MIRRIWWRLCARYYDARAARAGQDADRYKRRSEEFFARLGADERTPAEGQRRPAGFVPRGRWGGGA